MDTNDYNILSFEIENQNYFLQILNENQQMKIDMYFPISHAILGKLFKILIITDRGKERVLC